MFWMFNLCVDLTPQRERHGLGFIVSHSHLWPLANGAHAYVFAYPYIERCSRRIWFRLAVELGLAVALGLAVVLGLAVALGLAVKLGLAVVLGLAVKLGLAVVLGLAVGLVRLFQKKSHSYGISIPFYF